MTVVTHDNSMEYWKRIWRKSIEGKGGNCPCCGRWGKVYERTISRNMALSLKWLHNNSMLRADSGLGEWFSVSESGAIWVIKQQQVGKMRWWGLTERPKEDDPINALAKHKTKHSGFWRCTAKGIAFLEGRISVPERVWVHDDKVEAVSRKEVFWNECIPSNFDYSSLMSKDFNDSLEAYDASNKKSKNTKKYNIRWLEDDNSDLV